MNLAASLQSGQGGQDRLDYTHSTDEEAETEGL